MSIKYTPGIQTGRFPWRASPLATSWVGFRAVAQTSDRTNTL